MAYNTETDKIDKKAVDGLLGVSNSLAYKVHEIEKHFHNWERWFGVALSPSGETNIADTLIQGAVTAFSINAGNDDWGTWLQILGSTDTPTNVGGTYTKFDLHSIQTTANQRAGTYFVQFAFGATAADAVTAGTYTAKVLAFDGINLKSDFVIMMNRVAAGTKGWARCKYPGQNGATLGFYFGLHEYVG